MRVVTRAGWFRPGEDVAVMRHDMDRVTPPHIHEFYEVVYVADGPLLHRYGAEVCTIDRGDLLLINPHIPHGYELVGGRPAAIWNVMFTDEAVRRFARESALTKPWQILLGREQASAQRTRVRLSPDMGERVKNVVVAMQHEFDQKGAEYRSALRGYLGVLMAWAARAMEHRPVRAEGSRGWPVVAEAVRRIHESDAERPATVKELASAIGWSADHLNRLFRGITGETVQQYICRVQMARAAELMVTTELSIEQIAAAVGYRNGRTLRRAFQRVYGVGPRAYRTSGGSAATPGADANRPHDR